jgi:UDP-arabinose 4-epimerase
MAAPDTRPSVLVAGGAGYVGSHVCKALATAGYCPVTYDNLSQGHRWAVRWGPLERGDLGHAARLENAINRHRPIAVIHLAGFIAAGESVAEPAKYYANNVLGTLSLLNVMRRCNLERLVFSSSAAVYGEPQATPITEGHALQPVSPYGASKAMCERLLQDFAAAYGLRSISLRYFNAAGADPQGEIGEAHRVETHLIPLVLEVAAGRRDQVLVYGDDYPTADGTCVRDYVHVSDLAAAHVLALRHLEQATGALAFNLGSGTGASVLEVIQAAQRVTSRPVATSIRPRRLGDPAVLVADPSHAKRVLGWHPQFPDLDRQVTTAWNWHSKVPVQAVGGV